MLLALFNQGRFAEMETLARQIAGRFPNYGIAWKAVGAALMQQGQHAEALEPLQKAAALLQEDSQTHNNLGNTLVKLGRLSEAEASYRRALKIKPDFAEAHSNLGETLRGLGRLPEAETSQRKALEIKPNFVEAHQNLGSALLELGRLSEAEASLHRALELKPDFAGAHNSMGGTLLEQGRLLEAEASYRQALKIKPDYPEAQKNLGDILCCLDDIDQAIAAYQKVLSIDRQNMGMEAAVSLATLYYLNGNIGQCRSMLDFSRPINDTTGFTHKNTRAYWSYLDLLLTKYQKHNGRKQQQENSNVLYVVGESHSLSAHGALVPYRDREMNCIAKWIRGCKQWHLGNNKPNKSKYKFERILETLPRKSRILLLIGEIDCRPDEGIIKAWKKSCGISLEGVAEATAKSYLSYAANIAAKFGHRAIAGGIPATNERLLDTLTTESAGQLVKLIKLFNAILKDKALAAGMDFLDVFALTDRGDGIANGEWHIDQFHLLPSAMIEAFSKYLVASEHPPRKLN